MTSRESAVRWAIKGAILLGAITLIPGLLSDAEGATVGATFASTAFAVIGGALAGGAYGLMLGRSNGFGAHLRGGIAAGLAFALVFFVIGIWRYSFSGRYLLFFTVAGLALGALCGASIYLWSFFDKPAA